MTLAQKLIRSAKDRARYRRNREAVLARKRDYYAANRTKIIAAVAAYKRGSISNDQPRSDQPCV